MPDSNTSLTTRDAKLIQWLSEAHAKESELEADLGAHIALTQKASYKKRLQQHLKETRDHKRRVASRIKQLGGGTPASLQLPGVPSAVGEVAGKAVSAVKGQVGAARAAVTSQPETHLRNAQEELREEHVEIALYSRILTLAEEVGDRETAQLAKAIRRDEERMAKFLDAEQARLVKELVRAEIPRDQRATGTRTRRRSTRSTGGGSRSTSSSSRSSSSRSSGSRSSGSRSASRSGSSSSRASTSRASSSRGSSGSSRSNGSRASSSRSTSGSRNGRSTTARSRSGSSRSGGSSRSRAAARS